MNKGFKIALIIFLSFLFLAFSCAFVVMLSSDKFSLFSFNFDIGENQNLVFEKEYKNDYSKINVKSTYADVKFLKSEDSDFIVKLYADDDNDFSVVDEKGILEINFERKNNDFHFGFNNKCPRIEVYVPSDFAGVIDGEANVGDFSSESFPNVNLKVKLTTGDIKVGTFNEIEASTNTGDIKIQNSNKVNVSSSVGDIKINNVKFADVNNKTGDIKVVSVDGYINASTNTGDISVDNMNITKDSSLGSNTGDIKVGSTNELYFDAKTNVGDVKINNNFRDAKCIVKVKTNIGDIKINN